MSQSIAFYEQQADAAAAEAEQAQLENVRQRALRSEAAWRAMATRAQRIENERRAVAAEKAACEPEPSL
jgi:hypothetical protein